jgi:peptidoglycan/xylan/chitin deacetylase (PgdA/CDA1 family)
MRDKLVLCYHALSDSWEADLSTTPQRFERQLRLVLDRGYHAVPFTDLVVSHDRDRRVAITFDDAYRSVIELGAPILRRLGIPATVFVPTDYTGRDAPMRWPGIDQWIGGPAETELMPMSWDEIRSLRAAGWEIGSHSASHPHLTQLDDAALTEELTRSKRACETELGRACTSIAYPYGDVDRRVIAAAAAAGYIAGAALPTRLDLRGPLEWPRVGVYRLDDDRRFRLKVAPTLRRVRSSTVWTFLDGVRRRAGAG